MHEAQLDKVEKNGQTARSLLESAARKGSAYAQSKLQGPEIPEPLAYLWFDRFLPLHGMRRYGMNGAELFGPPDLEAANRLFDWDLQPHEVEVLTLLDRATVFPPKKKAE